MIARVDFLAAAKDLYNGYCELVSLVEAMLSDLANEVEQRRLPESFRDRLTCWRTSLERAKGDKQQVNV